jgi:hypothetical protein
MIKSMSPSKATLFYSSDSRHGHLQTTRGREETDFKTRQKRMVGRLLTLPGWGKKDQSVESEMIPLIIL